MKAVKCRNRSVGRGFLIGLLLLILGGQTTYADRLVLSDGQDFQAVWVQSVSVTPDQGPVFQILRLQEDNTWSQPFPVPASGIAHIGFRGPGDVDMNAPPLGRTATLATPDGRNFENCTVESLTIEEGKPTFRVRMPDGQTYPVLLEWISQGNFFGQGSSPSATGTGNAETRPLPENPGGSPHSTVTDSGSEDTGDDEYNTVDTTEEDIDDMFDVGSGSFGRPRATGFRGTLGTVIFWVGLIVAVVMRLWLWIMMFQTGVLWGLSQFVPCLNLVIFIIWLIQNWSDAKMPFLILLGSCAFMVMGAMIMI